jgi:hypothetical protein
VIPLWVELVIVVELVLVILVLLLILSNLQDLSVRTDGVYTQVEQAAKLLEWIR